MYRVLKGSRHYSFGSAMNNNYYPSQHPNQHDIVRFYVIITVPQYNYDFIHLALSRSILVYLTVKFKY